jgi:flagellar assembly protein FliH
MNNNVNSSAKIVRDINAETYNLGTFGNTPVEVQKTQEQNIENIQTIPQQNSVDNNAILQEFQKLSSQLMQLQGQVQNIEAGNVANKDLDKQIVQALKDLKSCATFFEKATFELESKILKTSMSIAKKIVGVELGEQSHQIAKVTTDNILSKIKTASQVTIHLNPKDYIALKDNLTVESYVKIEEDPNVTPGGVVIASDIGNFDGNIEAKIETILESLDIII